MYIYISPRNTGHTVSVYLSIRQGVREREGGRDQAQGEGVPEGNRRELWKQLLRTMEVQQSEDQPGFRIRIR